MTLKEVLEEIKAQAEAIPQVTQVILAEPEQIGNQTPASYPLVVINTASFEVNIPQGQLGTEEHFIEVSCLDREMDDNSNLIDCYNWTHNILKTLTSRLNRITTDRLTIEPEQRAQKTRDTIPDESAGWLVSYRVTIPYEEDIC